MITDPMTKEQKDYLDWFRLPYFPSNHRTPTTRTQAEKIIRAAQERAGLWGDEAQKAQMDKYKMDSYSTKMYDKNRGNKGLNK